MVNALVRCCNVDDEKTKARKRKLIKSFKSKQRFQMMDLAQKEKADAWKSFVQGKRATLLFSAFFSVCRHYC